MSVAPEGSKRLSRGTLPLLKVNQGGLKVKPRGGAEGNFEMISFDCKRS